MEMDIKKEGSFFMRDAYKEEKKKYGVRYLSTAKRLSNEEIASMSKKDIKAEEAAIKRRESMCEDFSPEAKMLTSNSVDLIHENCERMIYGVCGFFIDLKGRDATMRDTASDFRMSRNLMIASPSNPFLMNPCR